MLAGEAETCSWQGWPVCWRTWRGAPGKLLLAFSGQISASGLFLFPKNTDNVFMPLCSNMRMHVHEALPHPNKGGCRSVLACRAIDTQTMGTPALLVWWQWGDGEKAAHPFTSAFAPFIHRYQHYKMFVSAGALPELRSGLI